MANVVVAMYRSADTKIKKHLNMTFHSFGQGVLAELIFTVFGTLGQIPDVITHIKFQIDQSRGFGATSAQNRGFPIDFDCRPCNSVMH